MGSEQLEKLVKSKIEEALNNSEHPKKFFITANGRGITDGGDLYNALLKDVLGVVSTALVGILSEVVAGKAVKEAVIDNAGKVVKQAINKVAVNKK